jgi:hypothetical protein
MFMFQNYVDSIGCEPLDLPCRVQNATQNGLIFSSTTPCNCCETCLTNLKEGDDCSIGEPGSPFPKEICGDHLYCTKKVGDLYPTCQPMLSRSVCYQQKAEFNENLKSGMLGHLLESPTCDGDGYFSHSICIPGQNCFCVNEKGDRIFGDSLWHKQQSCECSRINDKLKDLIDERFPYFSMRCKSDGSFERLQCFGELCICVDEKNGFQTSRPSSITELPCFDEKIHPKNATELIKPCEVIKQGLINIIAEAERSEDYIEVTTDICDPDGSYSAVQTNDLSKFCADKNGVQIENFSVKVTSADAKSMNCRCARARMLLKANNYLEIPDCCSNGNYKKLTCRRGYCYCVDENGRQSSVEVFEIHKKKLPCKENECN